MPPILLAFLDCFALSALAAASIVVASLVLFALLLFFVGCVVVGSFSLLMIATKKKGQAVGACPLFVGYGLAKQNRAFRPRKIRNY